jgi:putative hydrolase of the HAD superfamily
LIKAIFFDYDGVLTTDKTGSLTTTRYISHATGIDVLAVKAAFARHNGDLTLGRKTHARIWRDLCSELGREVSISLLYEAFESTPINEQMFSLARKLKRDHSVGIVTDNKKDRIDHLKRYQRLEDLFNPIVVSAEVGFDKASTEIFLYALDRAGVRARDAIFIDNNRDNLVAANALGMRTVFHDDEANDIQALVETLGKFGIAISDA